MKIGFNVKKIYNNIISYFNYRINDLINTIQNQELRIQTIEDSEWVKLSSVNGNIEINQKFSEIRMIARVYDTQNIAYSFSCNYDVSIFHNLSIGHDVYFITGNPIANNYGCKFKYTVTADGKQYISVDSCYNGNNTVINSNDCTLEVWIKPKPTGPQ